MSLFTWFKRVDNKVRLEIQSHLEVKAPMYYFDWNCNDDNYAELLKKHFNKQLIEYKHEIAKEALFHLSNLEMSELKSKLKNWNGRKHCWK
jgi:hypothetical protein